MMQGKMTQSEAIEMMERASAEIKELRRTIERLAPKAEAYDRLGQVLNLLPRPSLGAGEDVAWMLDRRIVAVKDAMAAEKGAEPVGKSDEV